MQVPPLETHRRDGLFFKYSTRELSLVPVSDTPLKLPGQCLQLFEKVKPIRLNRTKIFFFLCKCIIKI